MNNRLFVLFASIILVVASTQMYARTTNVNDEKPVVLFVEFEFEAEDMETAIELLTEMQNQTLENEEGCIAYDILVSKEHPTTIYLYECYENSAAIKKHNNSSYYKSIAVNKINPLVKKQKILTLNPINDIGTIM